jgi:hypothetical protein
MKSMACFTCDASIIMFLQVRTEEASYHEFEIQDPSVHGVAPMEVELPKVLVPSA